MPHETFWIPQNLRTAPTPRHHTPGAGVQPARGRTSGPGVRRIRLAVASGLAAGRRGGLGSQADPWPPAPVDRPAVHSAGRALAPGGHSPWLRQRAVDLTADRGGDPGAFWGALSPGTRVEALAPLGLELSGARTPGEPTRRTGHCALEALHMARDKKKPDAWEPTWPSWMKVAFSSSRPAAAPGHPRGIRPSLPTTTGMTGSQPWRLSPSRRSASMWACTSASSRTTSKPSMWPSSSARSCSIFGGPSSYCGTAARFIGGQPLRRCARPTPGCTWKSSRPTRRNSIPRSRCGTTSKGASLTACCGTRGISAVACLQIPAGSGGRRRSCGRSSAVPSSHPLRENIVIASAKLNNDQFTCRAGCKDRAPRRSRMPAGQVQRLVRPITILQ
jgi:hypothetical protein